MKSQQNSSHIFLKRLSLVRKSGTVLFMSIQYYTGCTGFQCGVLEKLIWQHRVSEDLHVRLFTPCYSGFQEGFFSLDSSQAQFPESSPTRPQHSWGATQNFYPQVIENTCTKAVWCQTLRQLHLHACAKRKRPFSTLWGLSSLFSPPPLLLLPGPPGTLPHHLY